MNPTCSRSRASVGADTPCAKSSVTGWRSTQNLRWSGGPSGKNEKRWTKAVHTAKMLPYEVEKRWPGVLYPLYTRKTQDNSLRIIVSGIRDTVLNINDSLVGGCTIRTTANFYPIGRLLSCGCREVQAPLGQANLAVSVWPPHALRKKSEKWTKVFDLFLFGLREPIL